MNDYERDYLRWYTAQYDDTGKAFDPSPLVQAACAQWTDRPELAEAFTHCVRGWSTELYTYFPPPPRPRTALALRGEPLSAGARPRHPGGGCAAR